MLAKKYRLQVQGVGRARGVVRRTPLFVIKIFPAAHPWSRFAVVIPARVIKSAVGRNVLRRRVMESIEKNKASWPVADYWISALPVAATASREKIYESFIPFYTH